jgi:multiple sugar transport system substrate-binding protein
MLHKISFVVALLLFLTACVSPAEDAIVRTPSDVTAQKITISFMAPESQRFLYQGVIDTFKQQNPDINVVFISVEEAYQQNPALASLSQTALSAQAADTTIGSIKPSDITQGYVANLRPLIDSDPTFQLDDYFPQSLIPMSADGGMYILPQSTYVPLLYYNKQLLPNLNAEPSWDEVLRAAEQVAEQHRTNEVYGLMDGEEGLTTFLHLVEQADGKLFDIEPDTVQFQQPVVIAAAERVRTLISSRAVYSFSHAPRSEAVTMSGYEIERLVRNQQLGMWRPDGFAPNPTSTDLGFAIGSSIFPQSQQMKAVPFRYGFTMSSGTRHPEAAWRWLSFLSRQPLPNQESAFNVPARRSLAEQTKHWSKLSNQDVLLTKRFLEQPFPTPAAFTDGQAREALLLQWSRIISQRESVDVVLAAAQSQLNTRLQSDRERSTNTTDETIVVATPEVVPPDVQVINFGLPFYARADIRAAAQAFEQQHPNVRVKVHMPGNADSVPSLVPFAQAYDCFVWPRPPTEREAAALLDLAPLITADPTFPAADYPPALRQPFRSGTRQLGLPYSVRFSMLAYNQVLFDRLGVSTPQANWTTEQFIAAAQQLTNLQAAPPHYGYGMTFGGPEDVRTFLAFFGAATTTNTGNAVEASFTSKSFIDAVQFYTDLLKNYSPHRELPAYSEPHSMSDDLSEGQAGMWITSFANAYTDGSTSTVLTPKLAPLPRGKQGENASTMFITGSYISATSPHPQACWDWITFLSTRAGSISEHDFPARRSVAQSAEFAALTLPGTREVYAAYQPMLDQERLDTTPDLFVDPQFDPFWLYRAIDRILQGGDAEQELRDAEALTRQYYACLARGQPPVPCAESVDPTYAGFADFFPTERP